MSFSGGLLNGTRAAGAWQENYKKREEEEVTNKLFTAGQQLATEEAHLDAEGNEIAGMSDTFNKASVDDMAGMMIKRLAANGGKIDDNTARLAYDTAENIVGMRDKAASYGEKRQLFQAKKDNYESMIARREYLNKHGGAGGGVGGGAGEGDVKGTSKFGTWLKDNGYTLDGRSKTQKNKLFSRFMDDEKPDTKLIKGEEVVLNDDGTPDLTSIKVGGKLFKSLTSDVQRSVQIAQGYKGTPAPKAKSDLDNILSDTEEPAAPKQEKRKSSGKAPKGVKDGKYTVRGKKVEVIDGVMYPL